MVDFFFMIYNLKRKKNRVIINYAWQTFFIIIDNELTINTNYGKCKGQYICLYSFCKILVINM